MISKTIDKTAEFNTNNGIQMDMGGWQTISVQFVNPSGTIDIEGTNDSGAIEGVSDGNAQTSANYMDIEAVLLADGTEVTAVAADGIYRITVSCKFVRFAGAAAAAEKVIVFMTTPT